MIYKFCMSLGRSEKRFILMSIDIFCIVLALFGAMALADGAAPDREMIEAGLKLLAIVLPIGVILTLYLGLHRIKLNAYELQAVIETALVAMMLGVAGAAAKIGFGYELPLQVFVNLAMLFLILSVSARLLLRNFLLWVYRRGQTRKRVLIYGAGQTGQQLVAALNTDNKVEPIAFVDDNPTLQSLTVAGLKVHSPVNIQDLVKSKGIDLVVLAMPETSQRIRAGIARRMREIGCDVHALPSFAEIVLEGELSKKATSVELSELLGRSRIECELPGVRDAYQGRHILVTGAGGSIGSELCRQLLACKVGSLILLDHSETALYNIQRELREMAPHMKTVPVLGSVFEPALVRQTLEKHRVEVVLHAAAYKHLPMVEENCIEGLRDNVLGTKVIADAARAAGVERFILVSTDKAVRPTSVMGSSKRLAEMVVQDLATRSEKTRFSMVRFGNVLGSSGSVIPLFEDQIARGGPVTLTHRDVTRYFMTISEAVRLVLLAGSFARGGDVFVLDMGKPVPIRRVARQMIEGAGYTVRDENNPDGDIEIQITGLRRGEKLHEELLIGSDMLTTPHPKILRAQEGKLSEIEMANALQDIRKAIELRDEIAARQALEKWVEQRRDVSDDHDAQSIINQ